ncbi:MAG: FAD-dependent oxidoreductase [Burkholderiales bacterium]
MSSSATFDVVVIGAGCAGLCAAVEAAETGLSVAVLEKLDNALLNSTVASGGYFAFIDTDLQRRQRILDSDEAFRRDMAMAGGGKSDPALVDLFLQHQLDTYYWLQERGINFSQVEMGIGMNVPRCHAGDGQRVIEMLLRAAARLKIDVRYRWPANALTREEQGFTVSGPQGQSVIATGGVILATGGFSRNPALLARLAPGLERVRIIDGGLGGTGDGIVMAEAHGAELCSMESVKPNFFAYAFREATQGAPARFHHDAPVGMVYHLGGVLVNQSGQRYIREDLNAKDIALATLKLPEAMSWGIYDESVRRRAIAEKTIYINPLAFEKSLRADSLAELAGLAKVPEAALIATIKTYNEACKSGQADAMGREFQTAKVGKLFALEEPPFYAFPTAPNLATTFSGVRINTHIEVVNRDGKAIEGLYACGEMVGGFHGMNFMTGTGLSQAAIFGRLAARHIADRVSNRGGAIN